MLSLLFGFNQLIFTTQEPLNDIEVTKYALNLTGLTFIHRNGADFFTLVDLLQGLYTNIHEIENTKKMIYKAQTKIESYDYIISVLKRNIDLEKEQQHLFDLWKKSQFKDKAFPSKMKILNKTINLLSKSRTTENLLDEISKLRYRKGKEIQMLLKKSL